MCARRPVVASGALRGLHPGRPTRSAPWARLLEVRTCGSWRSKRQRPRLDPRSATRRHVLGTCSSPGSCSASSSRGPSAVFVIAYLDTNLTGEPILSAEGALGDVGLLVAFSAFPLIGYLLAVRRPDNSIGWVMLGMGVFMGLPFAPYATYAIHGGPGGRDLGLLFDAIDQPMWIPVVAIPATFLLLLFPNGHLPSPRWRWFARILGGGLVFIFFVILFSPGPIEGGALPGAQNPLGLDSLRPFLGVAFVSILIIPIGAVGSLVSLVQRFRRSRGIERLQLRWLVTAATIVAATYAAGVLFSLGGEWTSASTTNPEWLNVLQTVSVLSFALIPIAIGVSILRYHLFEIDVVINRALLVGALAVFIAVVYVAIVAGVGAVVGGQASPLLSAAAAGVVALAFQPARRSAQRFADRLVYGKRATPYEVLSEFSERVGNTYASDELLPRMARALGEGTGAARADVWVRVGDELRPEAAWPEDGDGSRRVPHRRTRRRAPSRLRRCSSRSAIAAIYSARCRWRSGRGNR